MPISLPTVQKYKVNVHTGDVFRAGTDANVFVTIYGDQGDTGERQLKNSETFSDKFERGHVSALLKLSVHQKICDAIKRNESCIVHYGISDL